MTNIFFVPLVQKKKKLKVHLMSSSSNIDCSVTLLLERDSSNKVHHNYARRFSVDLELNHVVISTKVSPLGSLL